MSSIKNVDDLRELLLEEIGKFRNGETDIQHATALGKLSDSVLGTIKTQFEYAKFLKETPMIPFMDESHHPREVNKDFNPALTPPKKVGRLTLKPNDEE